MHRKHNKRLTVYARQLRKTMTKEERKLWYEFLRECPVRFLRQKVIGQYIVDFYCAQAGLILEIDGGQHYEEENLIQDRLRSMVLTQYGLEVLRFTNLEVKENFFGVCEAIELRLKTRLEEKKYESLHR